MRGLIRKCLVWMLVTTILMFCLFRWYRNTFPHRGIMIGSKLLVRVPDTNITQTAELTKLVVSSVQPSPKYTGVPKIIHQVWTDEIVPKEFVDYVKGLVKLNPHPEWKYYYWTMTAGQKLIERKHPSLMKLFKVSDNTQKANIIRLVAIFEFGGAYFDLDTVGVKPLKPFMESTNCSLATEPPEHYLDKDMIVNVDMITNNVLICQPNHPFYREAIRQLEKQPVSCTASVQCSGPHFVSHVFHEMRKKKETIVLIPRLESYQLFNDKIATERLSAPNKVCFGKKYDQTEVWRRSMCDEWIRRGKSGRKISTLAYTYHTWFHFRGKKVTKNSTNTIRNIVPHVFIYD